MVAFVSACTTSTRLLDKTLSKSVIASCSDSSQRESFGIAYGSSIFPPSFCHGWAATISLSTLYDPSSVVCSVDSWVCTMGSDLTDVTSGSCAVELPDCLIGVR